MWQYEKKLEYPVCIKRPDPRMAKLIITQYGGPDGELGASLRYLSQRYAMPTKEAKGILTDVATEELAHLEIVGTMVRQLLQGASDEQIMKEYGPMYVDHGLGVYPMSAGGVPYNAFSMQVKGDPITDIAEDMGAEQKARSTYEYLLDMADDPDVIDPLRFLRQREIVHFQRFGEPNHTNLRRFFPYLKCLDSPVQALNISFFTFQKLPHHVSIFQIKFQNPQLYAFGQKHQLLYQIQS